MTILRTYNIIILVRSTVYKSPVKARRKEK
nr:MAG TPA: hypothetical protein [Bacteriophage sp.]DAV16054.1 MAG TPA: hypothetical protein [Caudoviricetes sp.]